MAGPAGALPRVRVATARAEASPTAALTPEELEYERAFLLGNLPPLTALYSFSERGGGDAGGVAPAATAATATYEQLVQLEDVRVTATPAALAALRRVRLGRGGVATGVRESVCLVCQEDFEQGDEAVRLACSHTFHAACAGRWLSEYSNKCPVCKARVG